MGSSREKRRLATTLAIAGICSVLGGCMTSAKGRYFGKTVAPTDNVLRYTTGPEPETFDPQVPDGQPEARIFMALFDGLVEYGPKDQQPIPAIAKSWEISPKVDEFVFHLRDNAKWSDGTPITAEDFVYSIRRGFDPDTLSRTANLGYAIKYSEAFNGGQVFVKKNGAFVGDPAGQDEASPLFGTQTEFGKAIHTPARLTLEGDEKKRAKQIEADPKLKALTDGAEFVPVKAKDIGVEAVDPYTLRITLRQSAPYFLGLLAHQFFRLVPRGPIEKYGRQWVRPEHILTCGAFRIKTYRPYDTLVLERDPNYWDVANVHLDGIEFYPIEDNATKMNLYKAGSIDAFLNHTVPASWVDEIRQYKDEYLNFPENSTASYGMNTTKAPFDNIKVRRAFSLATDRIAVSDFRRVTKPCFMITPSGIFPDYDKAMQKVGEELRQKNGETPEQWANHYGFDPERARKMLTEAGFPVQQSGGGWACPTFPTDKVSLSFNTNENNKAIAEFVQAQWKQNLGVTIPLQQVEFRTFLADRHTLQYVGLAQLLWSGDYMDPYTFLGLHSGKESNGDTGFYDPKYDAMLNDANAELDTQLRYEKLARAEYYLLDQANVISLTIQATNWMKKPYVKGMYPNPGTLFPWKFVYIEKHPSKWDHDVENIMKDSDPQADKQLADLVSTQTAAKQ
jgi:oligopeptide transport system substrate-binding protein